MAAFSSHQSLLVVDCSILDETNYFDSFFTLEAIIALDWNFNPDTSIERNVQVTVRDDSGQSSRVELDSYWRYSSEIEADLDSARFLNSTEFVSPGESSEFKFDVVWTKSGVPVSNEVPFSVSVNEYIQHGVAENGIANLSLIAPNETGIHPITVDLENLPIGAIDRTDSSRIVNWMIVDSNTPKVLELLSPDSSVEIQERDWQDLRFEIMISEIEGLDLDSIRMHWLVLPSGMLIPELAVLGGNETMQLIAGTGSGTSIPLYANLDVDSIIPEVSRENAWDLWIWVEGQDLAGQQIDPTFNNRETPMSVLQLAKRDAELRIDSDEIRILTNSPTTNKPVTVNITVHNDGQVDGSTSIRLEAVEDGDNRRLIEIINVAVPASSSVSFEVKWVPEDEGAAWLELTTPDGMFERTTPIQIGSDDSGYVVEGLEGASTSMLTGFAIILFLMLGLLGFLIISGRKHRQDDFEESEFI